MVQSINNATHFPIPFPQELPPTNTNREPANVFNMPNCLENICPKVGRYLDTVKHLLFSLFRLGSRHLPSNVHDLPGTASLFKAGAPPVPPVHSFPSRPTESETANAVCPSFANALVNLAAKTFSFSPYLLPKSAQLQTAGDDFPGR